MTKKIVSNVLVLTLIASILVGCGTSAGATGSPTPVEIEVVASQPEYLAQEQEIWKIYSDANPHVTFNIIAANEDMVQALDTRIAAGNAPDIVCFTSDPVTKDNYTKYVNLLDIGYPYFDEFIYDARTSWALTSGVTDYVPVLAVNGGPFCSFIYYEDEMAKAGLNPRESVRSMADLDQFLADLKVYCDSNAIPYVLDTGWHSWVWWLPFLSNWSTAMGGTIAQESDLWNGEIQWTDLENNPYVAVFEKVKEYTEKGYFPAKWWTRAWEGDYEAGLIARKSILTYHGPWMWTKIQAADPNALLSGFPLPANENGVIQNMGPEVAKGSAMFESNKTKANYDEVVKAFIWWNSPETVKIRCEAFGDTPMLDLSDLGGADIQTTQYQTVIQPIFDGFYGEGVVFDNSVLPQTLAARYMKKDAAPVLVDDAMAPTFGEYFEGVITIEQLMETLQQRFDASMELP